MDGTSRAVVFWTLVVTACGGGTHAGPDTFPGDVADVATPPDPGPDDVGSPDDVSTEGVAEAFDASEPDTRPPPLDLSERLAPGQVRAGRVVKPEDLIGGRTAKGRVGDYKIYNSRVAFIVQDAGLASGYKRYGGVPVDADVVRPEGEPGRSQLGRAVLRV